MRVRVYMRLHVCARVLLLLGVGVSTTADAGWCVSVIRLWIRCCCRAAPSLWRGGGGDGGGRSSVVRSRLSRRLLVGWWLPIMTCW